MVIKDIFLQKSSRMKAYAQQELAGIILLALSSDQ